MSNFAKRVIAWQQQCGRHDLPWQTKLNQAPDIYAIWVSEIMLQQTQVASVIHYYQRFMQRFPTIEHLAMAEQDEVMQLWSGLGYYSRARNLHHAAHIIMNEHDGKFPTDFSTIQTLSGIGRSTAAAIASLAFNQIQTILDGNVKRVLTRHYLVEGWPNAPKVERGLWSLAESLLPNNNMATYTQGLMDLGATICTRSKPKCSQCPLQNTCQAYARHRVNELPTPKPKKIIPQKEVTMLIFLRGKELLLEKRSPSGIWGGLWSLPEITMSEIASKVSVERFGFVVEALEPMPIVHHAFTHFKLAITPQPLILQHRPTHSIAPNHIWLTIEDAIGAALPTPVRNILLSIVK